MRSVLLILLPVLPMTVSVWCLEPGHHNCAPSVIEMFTHFRERRDNRHESRATSTIIKSKISLGKNCIILTFSEQTFILRNIMTFSVARFNPAWNKNKTCISMTWLLLQVEGGCFIEIIWWKTSLWQDFIEAIRIDLCNWWEWIEDIILSMIEYKLYVLLS